MCHCRRGVGGPGRGGSGGQPGVETRTKGKEEEATWKTTGGGVQGSTGGRKERRKGPGSAEGDQRGKGG